MDVVVTRHQLPSALPRAASTPATTRRAFVSLSLLLWAALPAWGLGAAAPFVPPKRMPAASAASAAIASVSSVANAAHGTPAEPLAPASASETHRPAASAAEAGTAALAGIRSGRGAATALIDGAWHAPGARVRGATLSSVAADHAVLRHPDGHLERLAMQPAIRLHLRAAEGSAHRERALEKP